VTISAAVTEAGPIKVAVIARAGMKYLMVDRGMILPLG
jgi:hypothetical protein